MKKNKGSVNIKLFGLVFTFSELAIYYNRHTIEFNNSHVSQIRHLFRRRFNTYLAPHPSYPLSCSPMPTAF
ncbi:hypothetical protein SAMN05216332_110107 [Nitrosospira briensis]|nr:hypothetical protein SAMN05216332_110107 [Nitrosospira briensis]